MRLQRIFNFSFFLLAFFICVNVNAQDKNVAITDDANYSPKPGAMLDINSVNKGLLIPRVASTNNVSSPTNGLMVYQTSNNTFYYYDGGKSKWVTLGSGGGTLNDAYNYGGAGAGRKITANAGSVWVKTVTSVDTATAIVGIGGSRTSGNYVGVGVFGQGNYAVYGNTSDRNLGFGVVGVGGTGSDDQGNLGAGVFGLGAAGVYGQGIYGILGTTTDVDLGIGLYGVGGGNADNQGNKGLGVYGNGYFGVLGEGLIGTRGQTLSETGFGVVGIGGTAATDPNSLPTPENPWGIGVGGSGLIGLWGETTDPETGVGVWSGDLIASQTGIQTGGDIFAGGNLQVTGSKQFCIDHPLDPQNKYLKHFCLESPEVLNMYRGTAVLDANGEATVQLPDYFNAINVNYSYQLTAIGASMPNIFIKEKISGNTFKIGGGKANAEVSWSVLAERNDKFMQQHPDTKLVEVNKKDVKMIHPLLTLNPAAKRALLNRTKRAENNRIDNMMKNQLKIKKLELK